MGIETLIQTIEERTKKEIGLLEEKLAEEKRSIQTKKEVSIKNIQARFANEARIKSEREQARIIEAARLQAKKILFDAINANLSSAIELIKEDMKKYTKTLQYKKTLEAMIDYSKKQLGDDIMVKCRQEDKVFLEEKGVTIHSSIQSIGGIIIEDKRGRKELDLTFEDLLRTHEDEVNGCLMEPIQ